MERLLQLAGLILMGAALVLGDQGATDEPRAGTDAWGPLPKEGGTPKVAPKKIPPLRNPGSPAARFYRASPEQRERALEKLPVAMQRRIRKELEWFDSLPKDQQAIALKRTERLAALPPDRQHAIMQQLQALNRLDAERRKAVRNALIRLQSVSEDQRKELLARDQFRSRFSPEELQMITELSAVMLPQ